MKFYKYFLLEQENIKRWKTYLQNNKMLSTAVTILKKINSEGYKAYIVGGSVRDIILGVSPHDIDIATNMPISELEKIYKVHDIGKSKDFGIVVINLNNYSFEVAQFRTDGKYLDGRHPDKVKIVLDFKTDAKRRDFTINAMGIDKDGNIIDYFNGKKDIKNKIIRTVGNPFDRFEEDKLRIMRLARFSSKLGFNIDKDTFKAGKKLNKSIQTLPPERIKDELMKAASQSGEQFAQYLKILDDLKILKYILPELLSLKYIKHSKSHHPESWEGDDKLIGSVWNHVMASIKASNTKDPIKNLAIALHDIGKASTFGMKDGLPTYYGHAEVGIKMVEEIANRLKFSNKEKEALMFAVGNHMRFHKILEMKPSKILKLVNNDNWDVLVAVARADEYARGKKIFKSGEFEKQINRALKIKKKWGSSGVKQTMKLVSGNRVMKITKLPPGPKIGKIISQVTEFIINNKINPADSITIDNKIKEIGEKV